MLKATIYIINTETTKAAFRSPDKIDIPADMLRYLAYGVEYTKGHNETVFYPYSTIHHIHEYDDKNNNSEVLSK